MTHVVAWAVLKQALLMFSVWLLVKTMVIDLKLKGKKRL